MPMIRVGVIKEIREKKKDLISEGKEEGRYQTLQNLTRNIVRE